MSQITLGFTFLFHHLVVFNGNTWFSFFILWSLHNKTPLNRCHPAVNTQTQPTVSPAQSLIKKLVLSGFFFFAHIFKHRKQIQPFSLHYATMESGQSQWWGRGLFKFPVHCCGVSNTTRPEVLMGSQLLYFVERGVGKHTERGILCPGWSTWWLHAAKKHAWGKITRATSTPLLFYCSDFYLQRRVLMSMDGKFPWAAHRFSSDVVATLSVDDILLWREDGLRKSQAVKSRRLERMWLCSWEMYKALLPLVSN